MFRRIVGLHSLWHRQRAFSQLVRPPIRRFSAIENHHDIDSSIPPDADPEKRKKILLLEMDILRQEGARAPDPEKLSQLEWDELMTLKTRSARLKYYRFLFVNQQISRSKREKKEIKRREMGEKPLIRPFDGHIDYGLGGNTFFLRIYEQTMHRWKNGRLINALMFGQKLVLDCSYNEDMTRFEARNCAKQLTQFFAENRNHPDPFDVHYVNVDFDSVTFQALERNIPKMHDPAFPLNLHTCSYTDLFPREQLVYLTPHCRNDLERYDPNDIYIIGAMVDKTNQDPLSLARAKRDGLRVARLPFDRYLQWGTGSGKSLSFIQMIQIMLDIKDSGDDWERALRHVPRRKLVDHQMKRALGQSGDGDIEVKLEDFHKQYRFSPRTWGGSKLLKLPPKRIEKRLVDADLRRKMLDVNWKSDG